MKSRLFVFIPLLAAALASAEPRPEPLIDAVERAVADFTAGEDQSDDLTALSLVWKNSGATV